MPRHFLIFIRWWRQSVTARGASLVFVTRVLGAGLSLVIHVLLARWAGPTVYGTYSYAIAWVYTLSIAVGLGFPEASLRFIPTYIQEKNWRPLQGIVQRGEHLTLLASTLVSLLVTAGVWGFGHSGPTMQAILFAFWALPFSALVRFYTEACRAVDRIAAAYAAPRLLRPGIMIGGIVVLAGVPSGVLSGPTMTVLFGVSLLPILAVQRTSFHRHLGTKRPSDQAPEFETKRWLRVALPLLLVTGFTTLLRKTDLLFVGWILDMRATGVYQAAATIAAPVGFILSAVNAIAAPRFAQLHADNQPRRLRRFVRTLAHWLFWPTLTLSVIIALGAPFFLDIFGAAFKAARTPLLLLILSHLINAASGSVGYLLNMTGHHTKSAQIYGVVALLNLIVTPIFIHSFGLFGAAVATTGSSLLWNVWLHHVVQKRLGLSPSILFAIRSLD